MGSKGNQKQLDASGIQVAVVVSRYNEEIGEGLLAGALNALEAMGAKKDQVSVHWVPGAFELPFMAKTLTVAQHEELDAVVCLGAVIRGETAHFDYVCQGATQGIQQVMLETGIPVAFGVLTTDTLEQAQSRSQNDEHNKGKEAAETVIEMVMLKRELLAK